MQAINAGELQGAVPEVRHCRHHAASAVCAALGRTLGRTLRPGDVCFEKEPTAALARRRAVPDGSLVPGGAVELELELRQRPSLGQGLQASTVVRVSPDAVCESTGQGACERGHVGIKST